MIAKLSVAALSVMAVVAVGWVLFFAEDSTKDFFISGRSLENTVKVPTKVQQTPDDTGISDNINMAAVIVPSFDIVRISRNGTGVIAGRAAPQSDVYIYAKDKLLGAVVADRNGEWVLLYDDPLPEGPTQLSLKATLAGKPDVFSTNVVIVAVPNVDEKRFIEDETNGVIAILSPRNGIGPTRVLQKPQLVNFSELSKGLSLETLDYDEGSNAMISGLASKNSRVRIYLDNMYVGEVVASDKGMWSHRFKMVHDKAEHILRLDQLLEGDDVDIRLEQPFIRGVPFDSSKAKGEIIVRTGNSLWQISRRLYGAGFHYTLIFGANKSQIKDPNLIYPGQKFSLPIIPIEAAPKEK